MAILGRATMKKAPGSPHGFPPKLREKEIVIVHFAGRPLLIDCGVQFPFSLQTLLVVVGSDPTFSPKNILHVPLGILC